METIIDIIDFSIELPSSDDLYVGTVQNERIWGTQGSDTIYTGPGDDILSGGLRVLASDTFQILDHRADTTAYIDGQPMRASVDVTATLEVSRPELQAHVESLYNIILGRNSDAGGLQAWMNFISNNDDVTLKTVAHYFTFSRELLNTYDMNGDGSLDQGERVSFANALLVATEAYTNDALDEGQPIAGPITEILPDVPLADIVMEIVLNPNVQRQTEIEALGLSREAMISDNMILVYGLYDTLLGRDSEQRGLVDWSRALTLGNLTLEQVVNGFLDSPEFQSVYFRDDPVDGFVRVSSTTPGAIKATELTNQQLVTLFYEQFLGRDPEQAGLNGWTQALENDVLSQAQVAIGFLKSIERAAIMEGNGGNTQPLDDMVEYFRTIHSGDEDILGGGDGDDISFGGVGSDQFVVDLPDFLGLSIDPISLQPSFQEGSDSDIVVDLESWDFIRVEIGTAAAAAIGLSPGDDFVVKQIILDSLMQHGDDVVLTQQAIVENYGLFFFGLPITIGGEGSRLTFLNRSVQSITEDMILLDTPVVEFIAEDDFNALPGLDVPVPVLELEGPLENPENVMIMVDVQNLVVGYNVTPPDGGIITVDFFEDPTNSVFQSSVTFSIAADGKITVHDGNLDFIPEGSAINFTFAEGGNEVSLSVIGQEEPIPIIATDRVGGDMGEYGVDQDGLDIVPGGVPNYNLAGTYLATLSAGSYTLTGNDPDNFEVRTGNELWLRPGVSINFEDPLNADQKYSVDISDGNRMETYVLDILDITDDGIFYASAPVGENDLNFHNVDLGSPDLSLSNLSGANFTGADLTGANFTGADLTGAILADADLTDAILSDAVLADIQGTQSNDTIDFSVAVFFGTLPTSINTPVGDSLGLDVHIIVNGNEGSDKLFGNNATNDQLTGGPGADTFVFDFQETFFGVDEITDWESTDVLEIRNLEDLDGIVGLDKEDLKALEPFLFVGDFNDNNTEDTTLFFFGEEAGIVFTDLATAAPDAASFIDELDANGQLDIVAAIV